MPSLGADMDAGTLVEWRIAPGQTVTRGQVVAVVETEKGAVDVESWQSGVVAQILVAVGTKVPVGTVLATLEGAAPAASVAPPAAPPAPPPPAPPPPVSTGARPMASPAARRRAHEQNVELASVHGSGPHGEITVADVERAAVPSTPAPPATEEALPAPPPAPAPAPIDRGAAMRQAIAASMARSKREIPHYYLGASIDMGPSLSWLREQNLSRPVTARLLPIALQLKAVALALRETPELNGFWVDGAFRPGSGTHVGVAISLRRGGLVAPAIHDVDKLSLGDVMQALSDVTVRARESRLRSSELSDPTITVTALGERGVETVFGVIHPPQVAMVGFGTTLDRPWAIDGLLGVRPVVMASLSADHRVSDGHRGARFLAALGDLLQHPETL